MKKLPLVKGGFALVSDEDFDRLSQYRWLRIKHRTHPYIGRYEYSDYLGHQRYGDFRMIMLHREVMNASKGQQVDHINGDPSDNRRENLRFCTNSQNMQNRKPNRNSTSQYKGVWWDKTRARWRAAIGINKRQIKLGSFTQEIEAARAYDAAALKLFGEFARPNFI